MTTARIIQREKITPGSQATSSIRTLIIQTVLTLLLVLPDVRGGGGTIRIVCLPCLPNKIRLQEFQGSKIEIVRFRVHVPTSRPNISHQFSYFSRLFWFREGDLGAALSKHWSQCVGKCWGEKEKICRHVSYRRWDWTSRGLLLPRQTCPGVDLSQGWGYTGRHFHSGQREGVQTLRFIRQEEDNSEYMRTF